MQTLKISVAFLGAGAKSTALLVLHSNIFKQPLQSSKKSASSAPTLSPYRLTVSYAIACIQCVPCTPRSNPVLGHHQVCKCFHCLQSSHPQSSKSTEAKKQQVVLCQMNFRIQHPDICPPIPHNCTRESAHLVSTALNLSGIGPVHCVSGIARHAASCVEARLDLACLINGLIFQRFQPILMKTAESYPAFLVDGPIPHDPRTHAIIIMPSWSFASFAAE